MVFISQLSFEVPVSVKPFFMEELTTWDEDTNEARPKEPAMTVELPSAIVRALVNGIEPLFSSFERPFDPYIAVGYGTEPGEHDFYTCSCGVAGCAGLHQGVEVFFEGDLVKWVFPLDTYAGKFTPAFSAAHLNSENSAGGALTLYFYRQQYLDAIESLQLNLQALAKLHSNMQLSPCDNRGDPMEDAFDKVWPKFIDRTAKVRAEDQMIRKVFGDLKDRFLLIETEAGSFRMSGSQWRAAILPNMVVPADLDDDRVVYEDAARLIRSTLNNPIDFLRELNWEDVQLQSICFDGANVLEDQLPDSATPDFWESTKVQWVDESFFDKVFA